MATTRKKIIKLPKRCLLVLCGPPACGKSAFARRRFRATEVVSSDYCRAMLADDENAQWVSGRAFDLFHFIIRHRMGLGRFTVADSTALERSARRTLIKIARECDMPAWLLAFDVPLKICLQRNASRSRNVNIDVIERHHAKMRTALGSFDSEGFAGVIVLSLEEMDSVSLRRTTRR